MSISNIVLPNSNLQHSTFPNNVSVYRDLAVGGNLVITGDMNLASATVEDLTISNQIDMTGNAIVNVKDPVNPQDCATKNYVDSKPTPFTPAYLSLFVVGSWPTAGLPDLVQPLTVAGGTYLFTFVLTYTNTTDLSAGDYMLIDVEDSTNPSNIYAQTFSIPYTVSSTNLTPFQATLTCNIPAGSCKLRVGTSTKKSRL